MIGELSTLKDSSNSLIEKSERLESINKDKVYKTIECQTHNEHTNSIEDSDGATFVSKSCNIIYIIAEYAKLLEEKGNILS